MALRIRIRIEGADEVIRALEKLPKDAQKAMKDEAFDISKSLADFIKIDGRAKGGPQGDRAASTVKEVRGFLWPVIEASNTGRARGRRPSSKGGGVLFGSVFGAKGKFGWYAKRRYFDSSGRQYNPHIGGSGYWFRKTAEDRQPWIQSEWGKAAETVVREWSA